MEFIFNNNKTEQKIKEIIIKEITIFLKENKDKEDFESIKESFLRNRNYSFQEKDNSIIIYSL